MRRLRLASLGLAAVLSACSSSTASKTTIPSTTVPTTLAPTTVPAITTAVVPTTTQATTTMPPTTAAPTTTLAPTTTTVPLAATFQSLIDRYDAVVAAILADPRVATDVTNPKIVAYLALFPPNDAFTATPLKFWANEGVLGRFYRPGPGGAISKSTVRKVTATSSESEASFDICVVKSTTIVDASGNILESSGGPTAGTIAVVKVDGVWLIRDLTQASAANCPKPGVAG